MRILHVTPFFQHSHPGVRGPDRHYHFMRELSQRHEITVLTLARSSIPAEAMQDVESRARRVYAFDISAGEGGQKRNGISLPTPIGRRLQREWRFHTGREKMKETFHSLFREGAFDVVLFHGKNVFPVVDGWRETPIVSDFCDATSLRVRKKMRYAGKAKAALLMLRYLQVRVREQKMVKQSSSVAFISRRDREAILGPRDRSPIVANGIDLDYWRRRTNDPRPNCLIFTGVMDYGPNEDAALYLIDEILPRLQASIPDVELIIAGRDPEPMLEERAARHPQVTVTGFVEDMRTYMEQAAVFVAPLRYASGQQNKILEALAMEVPVVTTPISEEGVRVNDEQELPLYSAEGAAQFADCVLQLLQQPSERARLAARGRKYVEEHFSWPQSAAQLEQMCFEALEGSS